MTGHADRLRRAIQRLLARPEFGGGQCVGLERAANQLAPNPYP